MLSSQVWQEGWAGCFEGPHVGSSLTMAIRGYGSMMPISASSEPLGKHGPSRRKELGSWEKG